MELLLNLVWLALSAGVIGFFGACLIAKTNGRERMAGWIALVCVVCLLFPVISMTDDLNSSTAMAEPSKLKKLLLPAQMIVGLLAHVFVYSAPQHVWARLTDERSLRPQQVALSFKLHRRPPPSLLSLA